MIHRLILCLLAILLPTDAFAMSRGLDLDSALRDADLIARIKVISVAQAPSDSGYKQLAQATVTESIKGLKAGTVIELLSDNGFTCPNVLYQANDDCIIFARRTPKGHFETMNTYAGQFRIRDGLVVDFYLLPAYDSAYDSTRKAAKPETIIALLRRRFSNLTK